MHPFGLAVTRRTDSAIAPMKARPFPLAGMIGAEEARPGSSAFDVEASAACPERPKLRAPALHDRLDWSGSVGLCDECTQTSPCEFRVKSTASSLRGRLGAAGVVSVARFM
jgi:hypothetical protein